MTQLRFPTVRHLVAFAALCYYVDPFILLYTISIIPTPTLYNMETNLAATTAARKERLIALRKRKEATDKGETDGGP
jgi:hypothetical protein